MRKWLMLFSLGALALALALPAGADDSKRFKGSDCGPFTVTPISADPPVVLTQDVATGKASGGIGRYTLVAQEFVNLATLEVTGGQFTITARKGSISGTYSGSDRRSRHDHLPRRRADHGRHRSLRRRHGPHRLRRSRHLQSGLRLGPALRQGQRRPVRAGRRRRRGRRLRKE
jgi:hypothetical protein